MFVNLTPHTITILNGDTRIEVPPSGTVARLIEITESVRMHDGVHLLSVIPETVENLPAPAAGVLYIVSAMVREAAHDRYDVASPYTLVRDAEGRVIGCRGLVVNR